MIKLTRKYFNHIIKMALNHLWSLDVFKTEKASNDKTMWRYFQCVYPDSAVANLFICFE